MPNIFTIILTKDNSDLNRIFEQYEKQWQAHGIDDHDVSLCVFFMAQAVNQLVTGRDEFLSVLEMKSYSIEYKVCSTALERRAIDKPALMLSYQSTLILSSLAQLVDGCINSRAWTFDTSELIISEVKNTKDNEHQLTCHLSEIAVHNDQELRFTEFLDVVMTFASFDVNVAVIFSNDIANIWQENNTDPIKLSWRKRSSALKPVYGVDKIIIEATGANENEESLSYSEDVDFVIKNIDEYAFSKAHYLSW